MEKAGIPIELLIEIFQRLPSASSVLRCRAVCKAFRDTIENSTLLQYKIRLHAWNYDDMAGAAMKRATRDVAPKTDNCYNLLTRLSQVSEHIQNWSTLNAERSSILFPPRTDCASALEKGFFVSVAKMVERSQSSTFPRDWWRRAPDERKDTCTGWHSKLSQSPLM